MSEIIVPAAPAYALLEVKRSKFHCHLERADTPEQAQQLVARLRAAYPDANHVCSAFVAGTPGNTTALGCADDGEPSGTAGKPMLQVLLHGGVSFVAAAVAREFGGTKLGTGGLARAYGGSLAQAMQSLQTEPQRLLSRQRFALPYANEAKARHLLQRWGGELCTVDYGDEVLLSVELEQAHVDDFAAELRDACGGQSRHLQPPRPRTPDHG